MKEALLAILALSTLVLPLDSMAESQDSPVAFYGVPFPAHIAGANRIEVRDHEQSHPGLGYGVVYRRGDVMSSVYIYGPPPPIPDKLDAPVVAGHFVEVVTDVFRAREVGIYSEVAITTDKYQVKDSQQRQRLTCTTFRLVLARDQIKRDSFLCIGVVNGKFLKFRISGPQSPTTEAAARSFVSAWVRLLWPDTGAQTSHPK